MDKYDPVNAIRTRAGLADLVRLERVEAAATDRHESEQEIFYPPDKEDYFAPIPYNEKLINPNLN